MVIFRKIAIKTQKMNFPLILFLFTIECPKTTFSLKVPQKFFISKINLKRVFDLRNEFHANRMSFGIWGTKSFLRQFLPILTPPLALKIVNFGQNWPSRSEKLTTSLFMYEEPEKIGPETIWRPSDSRSWGFWWISLLRPVLKVN